MAIPSDKSPQIESVLSTLFGVDRRASIGADTCVSAPIGCGGRAVVFKDELSRREYAISGLCQDCQDSVFGSPDEEPED